MIINMDVIITMAMIPLGPQKINLKSRHCKYDTLFSGRSLIGSH